MNIPNLSNRPESDFNPNLIHALTTAEIEHIIEVYGRHMPNGAILWPMSALISLPWGILIGWWIWG